MPPVTVGDRAPAYFPSKSNRIALVGEAPGEQETFLERPFVGLSGQELRRMCADAGINMDECLQTNVFDVRPPNNEVTRFFTAPDVGVGEIFKHLNKNYRLRVEHSHHLVRLDEDLEKFNPNIIVALGATATWALLNTTSGVGKSRGAIHVDSLGRKVLPTYHPASVVRNWQQRPVTVVDLMKAKRHSGNKKLEFPARQIWIRPTLDDLDNFYAKYLSKRPLEVTIDIETRGRDITCIGFAPSKAVALVVPFTTTNEEDPSYWPTLEEEFRAWLWCKKVLESPTIKFDGQNGAYDLYHLYFYKIFVRRYADDTMLLHHSLWPELPKSLAFMGSIHTDERAWKHLGRAAKLKTSKREDQ